MGSERAPDSGDEPKVARTIEELRVDGREIVQAPEDFEVEEDQLARVECEQMIVRPGGIAFAAVPKHGDFHVSTAEISLEWLERAAQSPLAAVQGGDFRTHFISRLSQGIVASSCETKERFVSIPADLNDYLRKCCRQHLRRYVAMEFMLCMIPEGASREDLGSFWTT